MRHATGLFILQALSTSAFASPQPGSAAADILLRGIDKPATIRLYSLSTPAPLLVLTNTPMNLRLVMNSTPKPVRDPFDQDWFWTRLTPTQREPACLPVTLWHLQGRSVQPERQDAHHRHMNARVAHDRTNTPMHQLAGCDPDR